MIQTNEQTQIEQVLVAGDLGKLTGDQRLAYYQRLCETLGLNPLTQPFQYLQLSGKLVLYATKSCTDQLRQLPGDCHRARGAVSAAVLVHRRRGHDVNVAHLRARDAGDADAMQLAQLLGARLCGIKHELAAQLQVLKRLR